MKSFVRSIRTLWILISMGILVCISGNTVQAQDSMTAPNGVYMDTVSVAGMTATQIYDATQAYVTELLNTRIVLQYRLDDNTTAEITATAAQLGAYWSNTEIAQQAVSLGKSGNVVERYKDLKDLEHDAKVYEVEISFDKTAITEFLETYCTVYDQDAVDYDLTRSGGTFYITTGATGYALNVETSAAYVYESLHLNWDKQTNYLELTVEITTPQGSYDELSLVKDILGTYTSSFSGGTAAKIANITNGSKLINGVLLYPGEEFSFDEYAAPYTEANGYETGKAYEAGKLVDSVGGGICQVSSTLYNAVLRAELEVTMRYNHSMIVGYVPISSDATLAETSGKDFRFVNDTDYPIYIESYISGTSIVVNIYGVETRADNRTVSFESVVLETIEPGDEVIYTDETQEIGVVQIDSAYTGYKAQLWKIVKINGVETSRTQVNSSSYKAVARSATFGTATDDPKAAAAMAEAIATGSIDYVQSVMNAIVAGTYVYSEE